MFYVKYNLQNSSKIDNNRKIAKQQNRQQQNSKTAKMIYELSEAEKNEFIEQVRDKQREIMHYNLDGCTERKVVLFSELFQMFLSNTGKLLLRGSELLCNQILEKIKENSNHEAVYQNVEYLELADELNHVVENIMLAQFQAQDQAHGQAQDQAHGQAQDQAREQLEAIQDAQWRAQERALAILEEENQWEASQKEQANRKAQVQQ